jgi:hypothetical protein
MFFDFTFAAFEEFCQRITHMPVFTVAKYLTRAKPPPTPYLILRFDVDYREEHALYLARIAEQHHLTGSFYFRHHNGGFALDVMQAVTDLGHEVGYHFETLDSCQGDFNCAAARFLEHIELLRAAGLTIRTAAAHGGPPTASTYQRNYDLLLHQPDLLAQGGLVGETTYSIDFSKVAYISDASWHWRRYEYFQQGVTGRPTTLYATMRDLPRRDAGFYINFHCQQWFAHPAQMLYYRSRNRFGKWVRPRLTTLKQKASRLVTRTLSSTRDKSHEI